MDGLFQPAAAFRFLVQPAGSGEPTAAFTRLSGIKMQVETIQVRSGLDSRGVKDFFPVFSRFGPVTLSRGVVGDNDFMDWILAASAGDFTGPTGANLRRDLDVIAIDEKKNPIVTWTLKGAIPIGYELSPMDASRSEVLVENVTFAMIGIVRTTTVPKVEEEARLGEPPYIEEPQEEEPQLGDPPEINEEEAQLGDPPEINEEEAQLGDPPVREE